MDEFVLGILVAVIANGIFDAIVVAWLAGRRSKAALIAWLDSDQAGPYYDRIAGRAVAAIEPRIQGIEAKLPPADLEARLEAKLQEAGSIELDPHSLVETVRAELVPGIQEQIDKVRSGILGHLGFAKKAIGAAGEAIGTAAAEEAAKAAGLDPADPAAILRARLATLRIDEDYAKEHPVAAFGLELIRDALSGGASSPGGGLRITQGGVGYRPGLPGRNK